MIGYYNYTVWLTYIGLASGITGLYLSAGGHPLPAILCLLFSGFCDLFDGMVARTKKDRTNEERHFGIQIDSLSDLVCFGVLPCAIAYAMGLSKWYFVPLFVIFVLGGLIRLGYYNVTEEARQQKTQEVRKHYKGLPITSSAIIFPLLFCAFAFDPFVQRILYASGLLAAAICFVAPIRVPKPHNKGIWAFLVVGAMVGAYLITSTVLNYV